VFINLLHVLFLFTGCWVGLEGLVVCNVGVFVGCLLQIGLRSFGSVG